MDTQYPMERTMEVCADMGLACRVVSGPAGYRDYTEVKFWEPGMDAPREASFAANEPLVPLSELRAALEQGQWAVRELLSDYSVEMSESAVVLSDALREAMDFAGSKSKASLAKA